MKRGDKQQKRAVTVRERRAFLLWNVCGLFAIFAAGRWSAARSLALPPLEGKEARWYTRLD